MKRIVAVVTALVSMMVFVPHGAAQPDRDDLLVEMLVTGVEGPAESRTTANGKWMFLEDKVVTASGIASIGAIEYEAAIEAAISGKLTSDQTEGAEWAVFTLWLTNAQDELECDGTFFVKRYPDGGPVGYAEAGRFSGTCDDGTKIKGDVLAEFGFLDGTPGFLVTLGGTSR